MRTWVIEVFLEGVFRDGINRLSGILIVVSSRWIVNRVGNLCLFILFEILAVAFSKHGENDKEQEEHDKEKQETP